jgi:hypothetical protein
MTKEGGVVGGKREGEHCCHLLGLSQEKTKRGLKNENDTKLIQTYHS